MVRRAAVFAAVGLVVQFAGGRVNDTTMNVVHARFEGMNRHDPDAIARLYADSAKVTSPNWPGAITGPTQVRDTYARYFKSSPDLHYTMTRVVEGHNSVTVEYTSEGTLEKNEQGVPDYMRGKHYVLENITRMDLRDGKIVDEATYFDQVSFLRQMGFFQQSNAQKKNRPQ